MQTKKGAFFKKAPFLSCGPPRSARDLLKFLCKFFHVIRFQLDLDGFRQVQAENPHDRFAVDPVFPA